MLKPDISKKPLEKRVTKNTKNKENVQVFDNVSKNNIDDSNNILTQIREKYKKQIENVQIDQTCRNVNIIELQTVHNFIFFLIFISLYYISNCFFLFRISRAQIRNLILYP